MRFGRFSAVALACALGTEAVAAEPESARAVLTWPLVDQVLAAQLPLPWPGARDAAALSVVAGRACGVDARGRGRMLAVVAPAGGAAAAPGLLRVDDCAAGAEGAAKRVAHELDTGTVFELSVAAEPGKLRPALEQSAAIGASLSAKPRLAPLSAIEVGAVNIQTDGAAFPLFVQARPRAEGLEASAGFVAAPPAARIAGASAPASGANALLSIPLPFANRIIATLQRRGPFVIELPSERITVREVRLERRGGSLVLSGTATPTTVPQPVQIHATLGGDDLRVVDVRAEMAGEECAALSMLARVGCEARKAGRSGASAALGAALRAKYGGQLVRTLAGPQVATVPFGARSLTLAGDLVRLALVGDAVDVHAAVAPGR